MKVKEWKQYQLMKGEPQFYFTNPPSKNRVIRYDNLIFSLGICTEEPEFPSNSPDDASVIIIKEFHKDLIHVSIEILNKDGSLSNKVVEIFELDDSLADNWDGFEIMS